MTVTLGDMQERVEARVRSGAYASVSEVIRAGLRALEREEATLDAVMRAKLREALDDPSSTLPADQVFNELRAYHADRLKAAKHGA
ncbi:type II toxin-antitoxin system ParD family antitoxin [Methylobacterium sp. JK268]